VSYLEYIDKLSELKQTIVGGSSSDNIETVVWLIGFLFSLAVVGIVILILSTVVAVIMTSLLERLFTWVASLFGKDKVFDFDNFTPHCMLAIALCCLAIFIGTRSGGETTTKVETKMTSHEDSLVQLHNDLVNWNDSDFDELWNATVKYKLTKSDDDEYHEVVKVIKEVKQDRDKVKE
jgi:hypothetical protein